MDKSWIELHKEDWDKYEVGVESFLDFAFANSIDGTRIYCPCTKCRNRYFKKRDDAWEDIMVDGFWKTYRIWEKHGETKPSGANQGSRGNSGSVINDDMVGMIHEAMGIPNVNSGLGDDRSTESEHVEGPNEEVVKFIKLLQDAECPLYPNCEKFSKLSFIVRLLQLKVLCGWTDKSMNLLLELRKILFLMEECMTFCGRYLDEVETKSKRPERNYDGGTDFGRPLGKKVKVSLDDITRAQAHSYVLANSEAVAPFRKQYLDLLTQRCLIKEFITSRIFSIEHFTHGLKKYVQTQRQTFNRVFSDEINILANGPHKEARRFKGYFINGFRFRTKSRERKKATQNSGIMMDANTMSYASARDRNPQESEERFYGVLTDVLEIRYTNDMKFVLFKGDWVNNRMGLKKDEFKFTLVNFNHLMYKNNVVGDEPFIFAEQARQVCYVHDPSDSNWHVVLHMTGRDLFDMYWKDSSRRPIEVPQVELYAQQHLDETVYQNDADVSWVREGVDGIEVDATEHIDDEMEECD